MQTTVTRASGILPHHGAAVCASACHGQAKHIQPPCSCMQLSLERTESALSGFHAIPHQNLQVLQAAVAYQRACGWHG